MSILVHVVLCVFFSDTSTTESYTYGHTLALHDALPICYAVAKPAREVLFTVGAAEEKYKSKNFIDTAVYRGGDAVSGWIYAGFGALGLSRDRKSTRLNSSH